jgi:hypothetical protein
MRSRLTMATTFGLPVPLSEPYASIIQDVQQESTSATQYDCLEIQLRSLLLQSCECEALRQHPDPGDGKVRDVKPLQDTFEACIKVCCQLKIDGIARLGLVLLEDIVESLPLDKLQQFYTQTQPFHHVSLLWPEAHGNHGGSHSLQFIRVCNALIRRLPPKSEWTGRILLDLAQGLPLTDKSCWKPWGSVSPGQVDFDSSQDYEGDDYTFYQTFWSLQQDFANPFLLSFGTFCAKYTKVLTELEAYASTKGQNPMVVDSPSLQFLTHSRILTAQLESNMALKLHVLTQFSIVEAFLTSTQLPNIQAALGTLSKRSRQLLENLAPNHAALLQNLLQSSEVMWRDWKKNKCQPAAMQLLLPTSEPKGHTALASTSITKVKTEHPEEDFSELEFLAPVTMAELITISSSMRLVVPSIQSHLEEYVEALDPEAGIDEEYSPKRDKVLGWQALRLFSVQHLASFNQIRPNGDFENLVRKVYQEEYGVLIPGDYLENVIQPEIDDENEVQMDCAPAADEVTETVELDGPETKRDDEVDVREPNEKEIDGENESPENAKQSGGGENAQPQDTMVLDGNVVELEVDNAEELDVKMADEVTAAEPDVVEKEHEAKVDDAAVSKGESEKGGHEPAPVAVAHSPEEPEKEKKPAAGFADTPVDKETKVSVQGKEHTAITTDVAIRKEAKMSDRDTKSAIQSDQDEASLRRKLEAEARTRLIDQRKRKRGGDAPPGDRRTEPPARDTRDVPRGAGARSGDTRRGPTEVGIQRNGPGGRGGGSGGPIASGRSGPRGPPPPHGGRSGSAMPPPHQQGGRGPPHADRGSQPQGRGGWDDRRGGPDRRVNDTSQRDNRRGGQPDDTRRGRGNRDSNQRR